MKTVGEILKSGRLEKGLTVEKLSSLTKIDANYIQALEENNFAALPSATFSKGFIRNLAMALDKNPDEIVAVFRRDFNESRAILAKPRLHRSIHLAPLLHSQVIFIVLGLLTFVVYLVFQYRAVITPPPIVLDSPANDAIVVSPVNISGHTSPGTTITINDDLRTAVDNSGNFATKLNLSPGQTDIKITATNRFSRTTTKDISITVISQ